MAVPEPSIVVVAHDEEDNVVPLIEVNDPADLVEVLSDPVRDTGCATRLIRRQTALDLPLQLEGMHRFIPVLVRMSGGRVTERPVHHRPRRHGVSKFGIGVIERGWRGLQDCFAVRWMRARYRVGEPRR